MGNTWKEVTSPTISTSIIAATPTMNLFEEATTLYMGGVDANLRLGNNSRSLLWAGSIELGRTDPVSNTPYLDFHSGSAYCDFDSRIIASGGTGTTAGGDLQFEAANLKVASPVLDMSPNGHTDYKRIRMGGGNSSGYLFTSFPALGDGIHLGYNIYYNSAGTAIYPVNSTSSIISLNYTNVAVRIATSNSGTPQTITQFGTALLQNLFPNTSTWGGIGLSGTYTQDSGGGSGAGQQYAIYGVPTFSPTVSTSASAGMVMGPTINAASTRTISKASSGIFSLAINSAAAGTGAVTDAWTLNASGPTKTNGTCTNGYAFVATKGSGCTNNFTAYFDGDNGIATTPVAGVGLTIGGTTPLRIASVGSGTGTTAVVNASGDLVKLTSSIRFKKNVTTSKLDSALIYKLRPVEYDYKSSSQHDFGLIAEEVEKLCPLLINYDKEGKAESVKYDRLSVLLIAEIKKLNTKLNSLIKK